MPQLKKIYNLLFLLICTIQLQAQNFASMSVNKDTVLIGDPVYVQLKIISSTDIQQIDLSPFNEMVALNDTSQVDVSIESYGEWVVDSDHNVDMSSIVWKSTKEGKKEANTQIKILFWDNGVYQLPQLSIERSMPIQTPRVVIYAPQDLAQTAGDSTLAIMPIKGIIIEHKNISDYIPFFIGLLLLLAIIGLVWYLKNRKTVEIEQEVIIPERPAHELALEALDALKAKGLWEKGDFKTYQSELTHIIRTYLGKRYKINALGNTTEEILTELKKTDFNNNLRSSVARILQMADLIKFAKAKANEEIHMEFWNQAIDLVQETKIKPTITEA